MVGLMGSGKSILGKQLASRLSLKLVDLDDYIVNQEGRTIPEIFEADGEQAFRNIESQALAEVLNNTSNTVIATGGGTVLSAENRALMKSNGKVVWLYASPEILAERISGDANRPLLNNVDPLAKVLSLSKLRNPLYEEVAGLKVDTGRLSDEKAIEKILHFLSDCAE